MEKYKQATDTPEMRSMKKWVENYICRAASNNKQGVIGKRDDGHGGKVTHAMLTNNERPAHVCPFVRDSLDSDFFWIEESNLGHQETLAIAHLLLKQIDDFKKTSPAFDPKTEGRPAPSAYMLKTFLTFFPRFGPESSFAPEIDLLHKSLKRIFRGHGLMLGQSYKGCNEPGIWDATYKPLLSPYPAFAIRYMLKHDFHFAEPEEYRKYFPATPQGLCV